MINSIRVEEDERGDRDESLELARRPVEEGGRQDVRLGQNAGSLLEVTVWWRRASVEVVKQRHDPAC